MLKEVKLELAWLAGFFEGEGGIYISRMKSGYWFGDVSLTQQNEECIKHIQEIVVLTRLPIPTLLLPTKCSLGFRLHWNGQKGSQFLLAIRPYLHHPDKIARVDIFLRFFDPKKKGKARTAEKLDLFIEWLQLRKNEVTARGRLRERYQ